MLKSFNEWRGRLKLSGAAQTYWKVLAGALAALNAVALFLYIAPPGGTRAELSEQIVALRHQILAARTQATRLKTTAANVQTGSSQAASFETKYILQKRIAYAAILGEIQRMAKASGLQERDGVYTEEPIEGTADLSLLSATANYEGSYANLTRFLYETDHSPMLLMLDTLTAAPQQKNGQVNQISASMRFQTIVREP